MSESAARKRSRVACTSCQLRKRKCSGDQPCSTCAQFGYGCYYDFLSRKKKDTKPGGMQVANLTGKFQSDHSDISPKEASPVDSNTHLASVEANSGAAFVRRLGLKMDPAHAPRLHLFGWNIGERRSSSASSSTATAPKPIVDIISQSELISLATVYFEKVDPYYGFIDRDTFLRHVDKRWPDSNSSPSSTASPPKTAPASAPATAPSTTTDPYDSVLCGVAAFGYLFSRREAPPAERQLVESARHILEQSLLSESPSIATVTGWVLRVAYLRMTASPHTSWMASCSLMHMIEAAGLHLELKRFPKDTLLIQPSTEDENCDPEIRRRLFVMARHLNIWISFDLGRSRVVLHGATSLPPSPKAGDYTTDLFHLLPLSESLDPNKTQDSTDLETALINVLELVQIQPPLILAQCNLMLCIYRRLRALNPNIPGKLLERVLALSAKGLRAAREMTYTVCPWHQIANVPFQLICTLLAIDSRSSLAMLGDAMQTLREVTAVYDTDVTREAYSTAYLLILLHQRRKEEDTKTLGEVLRVNSSATSAQTPPTAGQHRTGLSSSTVTELAPGSGPNTSEFSWLGELVIDLPSLQNFDLEQFLTMDIPWPLPETGI